MSYVARAHGVKETLELQSALAPRSFAYDLRGGAAWSASLESGDVVLRDGAGTERYRVSAPLAWDSAPDPAFTNTLNLSVSKVSDGRWRVTLRPDADWLSDPTRQFPVSIDPDFSWSNGTTHFHGAQDCYLSGYMQAGYTFCAQTYLQTGWYNRPYRSIFKFDIASAIPSNATVSAAQFKAFAPPQTAHIAMGHKLQTITSDWDSTATWNNRKTNTPWTTSGGGGDVSTAANLTSASTTVQAYNTWYSWNAPLAAIQGWVGGSLPNYGFMLSADNAGNIGNAYAWASTEASTTSQFPADSTKWPTLDVTWTAGDSVAPPAPTNVTASYDADDGDLSVQYVELPDDAPSSGLAPVEARWSEDGVNYSPWAQVHDGEFVIAGLRTGQQVTAQLREVDNASNISPVASATWNAGGTSEGYSPDDDAAAQFAREYNVSNAAAATWLSEQDAVQTALDVINRADVGGLWFDNSSRVVHLQATSTAGVAAAQNYINANGLSNAVVDLVVATEAELDASAGAAQTTLADLIDAGKADVARTTSEDRVIFTVASSATSQELARVQAAKAAASAPAVLQMSTDADLRYELAADECHRRKPAFWLRTDTEARKHSAERCGGDLRGGQVIGSGDSSTPGASICTAGFLILDKDTQSPMLLTAGHCGRSLSNHGVGSPWSAPSGAAGDGATSPFGYGKRFENDNDLGDVGAIDVAAPSQPSVIRERSSTGSIARDEHYWIDGYGRTTEGAWLCLQGALYGSRCGRVTSLGVRHGNFARMHTCGSSHGDSGGPITAGHLAYGVLSGFKPLDAGVGVVVDKCSLEYQSVGRALSLLHAKIAQHSGTKQAVGPTMLRLPSLTSCPGLGDPLNCVVDSGQWSGNPTIRYAAASCLNSADCAPYISSSPTPDRDVWSSSGCTYSAYRITVIASNAGGTTYVPLRGPSDYQCLQ